MTCTHALVTKSDKSNDAVYVKTGSFVCPGFIRLVYLVMGVLHALLRMFCLLFLR